MVPNYNIMVLVSILCTSVWTPVPAEVAAYIQSGGTVVSAEATTADTNTDDEEDSVDWEAAEEGAQELQVGNTPLCQLTAIMPYHHFS